MRMRWVSGWLVLRARGRFARHGCWPCSRLGWFGVGGGGLSRGRGGGIWIAGELVGVGLDDGHG